MVDTRRTVTEILSLLADNSVAAISPQDLRDALVSWRSGHGQIYVPTAAAAAITISDNTNYFEATNPAWTLSSGAHLFDESAGNGRLTYTGAVPVMCHVACSISMSCGNNQQESRWRIGLSGVTDAASEVIRFISTGADIGSTAMHLVTQMTTGQYISLFARNATAANNLTLQAANIQIVTMPM